MTKELLFENVGSTGELGARTSAHGPDLAPRATFRTFTLYLLCAPTVASVVTFCFFHESIVRELTDRHGGESMEIRLSAVCKTASLTLRLREFLDDYRVLLKSRLIHVAYDKVTSPTFLVWIFLALNHRRGKQVDGIEIQISLQNVGFPESH